MSYLHSLFFLLGLMLTACTTSRPAITYGPTIDNGYLETEAYQSLGGVDRVAPVSKTITLSDQLQSVPGVTVDGQGPNARVRIHGGLSFAGGEPLFVVDGVPIHGFGQVYSAVNIVDVKSITVLKDSAQTAIYGSRGANGVIVIRTQSGR